MNRTSLPALAGDKRKVARPTKPWWRAQFAPADATGGPLDPTAPRALWRLIHIAEMAGLLVSSSESAILTAFRSRGQKRSAIAAELDRFKCSVTDLDVLVTLFSAAPRAVPLAILCRETLAEPLSLRKSLDHLDERGVIGTEADAQADPAVALTVSGMTFAVLLMYRVINASIRPTA